MENWKFKNKMYLKNIYKLICNLFLCKLQFVIKAKKTFNKV
jgi:hypothetical protein